LRYGDWADLMGYCALSASPVGRYLLDLHGEDRRRYAASDPLCDALQVLNHVQDCREDYRRLDRVYLPLAWFEAEGCEVGALDRPRASPAVRRVLDRALDGVDDLLRRARELPFRLRNTRLATESAVILCLAERLASELRRRDPLAERVEVGRAGWLLAGIEGCGRAMRRLANTRQTHNH
ncbi:MAG TPA: squalene/phytoene synthase family protein, partial [Geminicoccaceae bacterium]|nr:squalene/phytoene synthase family protein [Geminicoccaceae bacterium]